VFAIGGLAVRPFAESGIRAAFQETAGNGARFTIMDVAGSGESLAPAALTMDVWLADIEQVFAERVAEPAVWTGASIGAWLMLLTHQRHPAWFRAMCALAPAFDWDQQYVGPRLNDGRLRVVDGMVVDTDAIAIARRELLISMAPHHVLRAPVRLSVPMHVVFAGRDALAPPEGIRQLIEAAQGAPCTGELLTEADHGLAKLDSPLALRRYIDWLRARLAEAHGFTWAQPAPGGPGSAR